MTRQCFDFLYVAPIREQLVHSDPNTLPLTTQPAVTRRHLAGSAVVSPPPCSVPPHATPMTARCTTAGRGMLGQIPTHHY